MKTIKLDKIRHKGKEVVLIKFPYDLNLGTEARKITGIRWSQSLKAWHAPYSIDVLKEIKTIFDSETGELLGAHMVGAEVTELIQGYVLGQKLETTEEDLISTIFPHPTLSEMMHESVLDAYDRVIHM